MKFTKTIFVFILLFFIPFLNFAQSSSGDHKLNIDIPETALIGLAEDGSTGHHFSVASPVEAGAAVDLSVPAQNNNIWINYSSIVQANSHNRKIMAMIVGNMPKGIHLIVEAFRATETGKGKLGNPLGAVELSSEPSEIISNIGSCYTGKGVNNGHLILYKLEFDGSLESYADFSQSTANLSVVYTLTDYN